jgi:hypothetical protein
MITGSSPPQPMLSESTSRTSAYLRLCGVNPAAAGELALRPFDEIQDRLDEWAASLLPAGPDESFRHHRARGRAQLLLARAPARWPGHFLGSSPPPELTAAVQSVVLEAKRPLRQTRMTPQPIDLGPVSDVADETWKTFDKWPVLRGLTVWLLFSLLLASVFYVVRF